MGARSGAKPTQVARPLDMGTHRDADCICAKHYQGDTRDVVLIRHFVYSHHNTNTMQTDISIKDIPSTDGVVKSMSITITDIRTMAEYEAAVQTIQLIGAPEAKNLTKQ